MCWETVADTVLYPHHSKSLENKMNNQEIVVTGRIYCEAERARLAIVKPEDELMVIYSTEGFKVFDADESVLWEGSLLLNLSKMLADGVVQFGFAEEAIGASFFEALGSTEEESPFVVAVSAALVSMAVDALTEAIKNGEVEDARMMRLYRLACLEWADRVREGGLLSGGVVGDEDAA